MSDYPFFTPCEPTYVFTLFVLILFVMTCTALWLNFVVF